MTPWAGVVPLEASVFDMVAAVHEMCAAPRAAAASGGAREITVGERIDQLMRHLRLRGTREVYFDELVPDGATRVFIVVTFLCGLR